MSSLASMCHLMQYNFYKSSPTKTAREPAASNVVLPLFATELSLNIRALSHVSSSCNHWHRNMIQHLQL